MLIRCGQRTDHSSPRYLFWGMFMIRRGGTVHIDEYAFGHIVIDGQEYTEDVIILAGQVQGNWRRQQGHLLQLDDLAVLLGDPPQVLIIGKGYAGFMQVADKVVQALESRGISVHVAGSRQAVELYNQLAPTTDNLAAAIHLTC